MAEFDVQGKITFDTTQAQAALKQTASSADQAATATAKVGDAAKIAQPQIGQFGSALGLAGQAVGQLVPGLGQVVTVAGSATGVIQGLTTAGLGPLGIAIGVVSVAVTAGVKLWQDYKTEQEKTEESIRRTVLPTLADLKKAFDDAAKAALDEEAIQRRVTSRTASASDYSATIGRLGAEQTRLRAEQEQLTGKRTADMTAADMRRLSELQGLIANGERNLAQLQENFRRQVPAESEDARLREQNAQRLRAIQAEIEAAGETLNGQPPRTGGGGGRRSAAAPAEREDPNAAARAAGEELDRLWAQSETRLNERRARWAEEAAFQAELNAIEADDVRMRLESLESDEADAEALREQNAKDHADRMQAINDAVFDALESALSSSVDAWLSGTRSMGEAMQDMVKQVAKSLASEAIIQGLKATAMGLGALAVGSPSAALHFAEAGKWAAVGVAAGIAGAASGAFGGGGGGGAGGGAPAAATGGPALTPGANAGAGSTVVINWGSSGLVYAADRAQLGRDISGMISEAHGRLGRGA